MFRARGLRDIKIHHNAISNCLFKSIPCLFQGIFEIVSLSDDLVKIRKPNGVSALLSLLENCWILETYHLVCALSQIIRLNAKLFQYPVEGALLQFLFQVADYRV